MANEVTVTTAEKFIIDTWNPELNRAIEFKTIIFSMFTDWTKRAKGGDTFHLVDRHNLTTNTKSAGTDATPETITEGEQTFGSPVHQIVAQDKARPEDRPHAGAHRLAVERVDASFANHYFREAKPIGAAHDIAQVARIGHVK